MGVHRLILSALALLVLLAGGVTAAPGKNRPPVKVKVKRTRKKMAPGEIAQLKVRVKNRTREPQSVLLELHYANGAGEPFATENLDLEPKERRRLLVPCTVPVDHAQRRLRVVARIGGAEDSTKVRVEPGPAAEIARGRDLFLASCSGCHGETGADIRDAGFEDWLEAVREGEGEMPPIPGLSRCDVVATRQYVLDARSEPDPDPGEDPEPADPDWLRGREVFLASCSGCHGETGADIRHEDLEDWFEAVEEGEDDMPPISGLTRGDVRLARKYALDPDRYEVPSDPPPDPGPGDPTYDGAVKAVLDASCVVCHKSGNARGGVRADTYAEAFANRVAIVDSVEDDRMPTGGPLSQSAKDLLRSWLDAGAPER